MTEIRELVLTFLERLSHHALPKNRKRETLDACMLVSAKFVFDLDCFAKVKCNHTIDKYLLLKQRSGQICWYEHSCPRGKDVQRLGIELVCSTWQNRSKICNCQYFALAGKRPSKSLNRPFYSCVLSFLAFEWRGDWRWPSFDSFSHVNDAFLMLISSN